MTNDKKEEWRNLCEGAAIETDHEKLVELAEKINRALEEREKKLRRPATGASAVSGHVLVPGHVVGPG
jgi:uncharacterized protein with von Willebrand factor type A (vWA) domain